MKNKIYAVIWAKLLDSNLPAAIRCSWSDSNYHQEKLKPFALLLAYR